ncbi:hypothetical protein GCM10011506_29560 [Marivirga lumbricoides]|uniref:Deoxyribose-phosphate aldolase n=1 Tax=Marivirga lumbricoides TaxID=1046115 RepID=A0ABQ1MKB7_9BACT|nr:hypothetical protein GCM10011506_29560 [Marivirga lumbricoides]
MKYSFLLIITAFCLSCQPENESASDIINKSISYHGGPAYDTAQIKFEFRDKYYFLQHNNGLYTYKRLFSDSLGNKIVDALNNKGFQRQINEADTLLLAKDSAAFANSVNSVLYFALLPYGLDAPSVISERLADAEIKGNNYYTIKVTFQQEGGGTDYEDEFVYWFDQEDYSMDYLAYSYHTEGGGIRFREAVNPRKVNGIIFQDYNNYKAEKDTRLETLAEKFSKGELELLSEIDLEFTETQK